MSLEKYSNGAATTLAGNVDNTSDPVTISVASASTFPTTGDFRILIGTEILLVTGVSGTSFTCSRAQEGTSIASHTTGDAVTHILTAASLKRIIGEYNIVDTYTNRPTAGVKGRRFIASDGPGGEWIDNGSTWDLFFHGIGPLNPNISDFATAVNSTARWTTDTSKGIFSIKDSGPASGSEFNMTMVKTAPSTPWTMTVAFRINAPPGTGCNAGIQIRDSGTSKLKGFALSGPGNRLNVWNWTNSTTFSGTAFDSGATNLGDGNNMLKCLRVTNDGTNLTFWYSANFRDWYEVYTEAVSGNFIASINQVGIYYNGLTYPRSNNSGGSCDFFHAVCG